MVLLVDGQVLDVGFGGATPIGPLPLGGSGHVRAVDVADRADGDARGRGRLAGAAVRPAALHVHRGAHGTRSTTSAPNHYSSTHPRSLFTQTVIAQRWEGDTQVGLVGLQLTERRADGETVAAVDPDDLGLVLRERFGLDLTPDEVGRLAASATATRVAG